MTSSVPDDVLDEKTAPVATYSNRQDADIARARLGERGIDAVTIADDVHPAFQLTQGTVLRVMERDADRARRILGEGMDVSSAPDASDNDGSADPEPANLTFGRGGVVRVTAWTYVAAFVFIVAVILTGRIVGV